MHIIKRFLDLVVPPVNTDELCRGIEKIDNKFSFDVSNVFYNGTPFGKVLKALENVSAMVLLHVIWPDNFLDQKKTFEILDPVWDWLLEERNGISHLDYGAFHDKAGLII